MKKENQIYLRSSSSGKIMTDGRGSGITEKQLETINKHQAVLRSGVSITEKQKTELKRLVEKREAPFELSDTAKSAIEKMWLLNEKGFYKDIKSKFLQKGTFGEEDGLNLLSEIDGRFYKKNTERIHKGNRTGECDNFFTLEGKKIIQDVKCCWDAETFMNSDFTKDYEWQGRDYMDLYDADEFWLRYCLVDCPEHLVVKEKEYKWRQFYSDSMSDEEQDNLEEKMKPIFDQIERNLVYSKNPLYSKQERVKTFKIKRDDNIFQKYLDRIPHALKYYNTITLNGKNVSF